MKKFFSITLLALFLFQFVGYYFVYVGLQIQSKTALISRLDSRDYSEDETITLKVPFSLPYWTDSKDFERVDGEFEYQGQFYKLVKQKLVKDTLYVVCIKDVNEKKLYDAMADYVKRSNDLPSSSKSALKLLGSLIKDYVPGLHIELTPSTGSAQKCSFAEPPVSLLTLASPVFSPPPEHFS